MSKVGTIGRLTLGTESDQAADHRLHVDALRGMGHIRRQQRSMLLDKEPELFATKRIARLQLVVRQVGRTARPGAWRRPVDNCPEASASWAAPWAGWVAP